MVLSFYPLNSSRALFEEHIQTPLGRWLHFDLVKVDLAVANVYKSLLENLLLFFKVVRIPQEPKVRQASVGQS